MSYAEKVAEMLGVELGEMFRVDGFAEYHFELDDDLSIIVRRDGIPIQYDGEQVSIQTLLNGTHEMIRIPKLTPAEKAAVDYAKALGCKWLSQDGGGDIFASVNKPTREAGCDNWGIDGDYYNIEIPLSFISPYDKRPFYIY